MLTAIEYSLILTRPIEEIIQLYEAMERQSLPLWVLYVGIENIEERRESVQAGSLCALGQHVLWIWNYTVDEELLDFFTSEPVICVCPPQDMLVKQEPIMELLV